jgi:hypothetical protein
MLQRFKLTRRRVDLTELPHIFGLIPNFPRNVSKESAGSSLGNNAEGYHATAYAPVCRSLDVKGFAESSRRMMSNRDPRNLRMFSGTFPAIYYKQSIGQPSLGEKR